MELRRVTDALMNKVAQLNKPVMITWRRPARAPKAQLPTNKGMTCSLFEGCFTTHAGVKMYNRRVSLAGRIASAEKVNFLENPTGAKPSLKAGGVSVRLHAFEVKTLLVHTP